MHHACGGLVVKPAYDLHDQSGRDCGEHHIVIDTHPVVTAGRRAQTVCAVITDHVTRRVVRTWQVRAAGPDVVAISRRRRIPRHVITILRMSVMPIVATLITRVMTAVVTTIIATVITLLPMIAIVVATASV